MSVAAIIGPVACQFEEGQWYVENPDRFTTCSNTIWELFTTVTENGVTTVTGSMNLENHQWAQFSWNSLSWGHAARVTVQKAGVGTLAGGVRARVDPLCRDSSVSRCTAVALSQPDDGRLITLAADSVYEVTWTETDTSIVSTDGEAVLVRPDLGIRISGPAKFPNVQAWSFIDDYLNGRCDARTSSTGSNVSRGCVNHAFTPTLNLSRATSGASAGMVAWAQEQLNWHPGLQGRGGPLHYKRYYDQDRRIMCGSFKQDEAMNLALESYSPPDNPAQRVVDSCDEYSFAATRENPASSGGIDDGAECAQLTAVQTGSTGVLAADWSDVVPVGTPTRTELCVRAHVPSLLNYRAGSDFGNLVRGARLIDTDPFWVAVGA
ncbi:hypothetical protein [Amycolatopsis sp. NPDC006125]|uniref:hypothetical protein n=1 Tax=Amycolatopsis sp. NPDC006125 TaxID=3156730 RepID=UPI0033ABE6EE